jgi:D-aspartate ligase
MSRGIGVAAYDCDSASAGLHVRGLKARYIWPDPVADESGFLKALLSAGNPVTRPVLLDLEPGALEVISRNQNALRESFRFVFPSADVIDIAQDKGNTARFFARYGLGVPTTLEVTRESDLLEWHGAFPAVFKPRRGKGGRGQRVVKDLREAFAFWRERERSPHEFILQEWIPGPPQNLCTVGILCAPSGVPRAIFSGQRLDVVETPNIAEGVTSYVRSVRIPEILDSAYRFANAAGWSGLAELEFKRDDRDGVYKILEINPRVWAWIQLPISCGVDFPFCYYQMAASGDCESIDSFPDNVKYLRVVLYLYTQLHRLRTGKSSLGQWMRELMVPYVDLFRPGQRLILEDIGLSPEYYHWLMYYWREKYR